MKRLGYVLLIGGFLSGTYATALDVQATDWALFIPAAVLAAAGLLIAKRAERGQATAVEVLTANRGDLETSLATIVQALDDLIRRDDSIAVDDLRGEIDERLREALRRFADARESMIHLFGVQAYADIMSAFAAGERSVNRVWSASADGYGNEARDCLRRAAERFRDAQQRFGEAARAI